MKSVVDQELARAYRRLRDTGTLGQWTTRDEVGFILGSGTINACQTLELNLSQALERTSFDAISKPRTIG